MTVHPEDEIRAVPPFAVWERMREKDGRCTCRACWLAFIAGDSYVVHKEDRSGSGWESSKPLESNPLAEKEGFEPSFPAKAHGNRLGFPSAPRRHGL